MAGDLDIIEQAVWEQPVDAARARGQGDERIIHRYGRLGIMAVPDAGQPAARAAVPATADLSDVERLGLAALRLRESAAYPRRRRRTGRGTARTGTCRTARPSCRRRAAPRALSARGRRRTDQFLPRGIGGGRHRHRAGADGRPAVQRRGGDQGGRRGAERPRLLRHDEPAGRDQLRLRHPERDPDDRRPTRTPPISRGSGATRRWRAIGFSADWNGVGAYVEDIRARFGTRWTYCALLHEVPARPFRLREHRRAAAGHGLQQRRLGSGQHRPGVRPRDRAHLRLPGRVREQRLQLRRRLGPLRRSPTATARTAPAAAASVPDEGQHLRPLRVHAEPPRLGAAARGPQLRLRRRRLAGRPAPAFHGRHHRRRPRRHRRLRRRRRLRLAGPGRRAVRDAAAAWSATSATHAGGWRVEKHPRFLADTTGDGRADIVGFGNAGVYVSRAQADGTFGAAAAGGRQLRLRRRRLAGRQASAASGRHHRRRPGRHRRLRQRRGLRVAGAGGRQLTAPVSWWSTTSATTPAAGGWRSIRASWPTPPATAGPTSSASATPGSGCRAPSRTAPSPRRSWWSATSATTPAAGGSSSHPRFVADITGDGRADIVGFGNAGVYVSLAQADGSVRAGRRCVVANFGYDAGGWRVERHPRFLADTTGDGRPTSSASATPASGCRGRSPAASSSRPGW